MDLTEIKTLVPEVSCKIKVTNRLIEDSYNLLNVRIDVESITEATIELLVCHALHIAHSIPDISKQHKIDLALATVRRMIDAKVNNPDERALLHMLLENALPNFVDVIIKIPSLWSRCCYKY